MKYFFIEEEVGNRLTIFGPLHIASLIILFALIVTIIINRERIKNIKPTTKEKIRVGIAVILLLNMTIYYLSKVVFGVYDWKVHLPFHFCFIGNYLFIFALLFKKWNIYKISYFMSFIGPIPAIVWPDLYRTFDCYIFYHYIISHHFFLLATLFILYAYNQKITNKDIKTTFKFILIVYIIISIFNNIFNTNYIFSNNFPNQILELYPFLKDFKYPFIIIVLTGLPLLFFAYILPYFKNKEDAKEELLN